MSPPVPIDPTFAFTNGSRDQIFMNHSGELRVEAQDLVLNGSPVVTRADLLALESRCHDAAMLGASIGTSAVIMIYAIVRLWIASVRRRQWLAAQEGREGVAGAYRDRGWPLDRHPLPPTSFAHPKE